MNEPLEGFCQEKEKMSNLTFFEYNVKVGLRVVWKTESRETFNVYKNS